MKAANAELARSDIPESERVRLQETITSLTAMLIEAYGATEYAAKRGEMLTAALQDLREHDPEACDAALVAAIRGPAKELQRLLDQSHEHFQAGRLMEHEEAFREAVKVVKHLADPELVRHAVQKHMTEAGALPRLVAVH